MPDCHPDRRHLAKGFCQSCYQRYKRATDPIYKAKGEAATRRWVATHKEQNAAKHRLWVQNHYNTDPSTAARRQRRFGITPTMYQQMIEDQGGVCAICKQPETFIKKGKIQSLALDHDHETGQVRGLLCTWCNKGLGHFRDSTNRLESAINYLLQW